MGIRQQGIHVGHWGTNCWWAEEKKQNTNTKITVIKGWLKLVNLPVSLYVNTMIIPFGLYLFELTDNH